MPSQIHCPECQTAFAYSPALLGKTVQCRECAHRFTVSGPPVEELPVAAHAPPDGARVPVPPPLPARRTAERPPVAPPPAVADRDEPGEDRPRRRPARRERPGNAGVLAGLAAAVVLGLAVIVGGVTYILWPSSSKSTNPAGEGPTPAAAAPVAEEPARRFEDIIREAPHKADDNRGRPGPDVPQFNPPLARPPGLNPPGVGGRPPPAPPAFAPPLPAAPVRPAGDGPRFAPVVPLSITPARMAHGRDEIPLPGPVESVAVAGGGRYLLLHVPKTGHVIVFDVSSAKVVRQIDVPDPNALVAGGMNLFVIYQPGKNTVERWSCDRLEQQPAVKSPFTDPVKALALGCASNGPLVAALGGKRRARFRGATLAYFDPATLKEVDCAVGGAENPFGIGPAEKAAVIRVSANGRTVTGWSPERQTGTECDVIDGRRVTRYWHLQAPSPLLPAPDGGLLFGRGETLRHDMQRGGPQPDSPVQYVPATSGNWYVGVRGPRPGEDARGESVAIYQVGKKDAAVEFDAVDDIDLSRSDRGLDQTVILVPEAKVLITVAGPKRSKLVLRRIELK